MCLGGAAPCNKCTYKCNGLSVKQGLACAGSLPLVTPILALAASRLPVCSQPHTHGVMPAAEMHMLGKKDSPAGQAAKDCHQRASSTWHVCVWDSDLIEFPHWFLYFGARKSSML